MSGIYVLSSSSSSSSMSLFFHSRLCITSFSHSIYRVITQYLEVLKESKLLKPKLSRSRLEWRYTLEFDYLLLWRLPRKMMIVGWFGYVGSSSCCRCFPHKFHGASGVEVRGCIGSDGDQKPEDPGYLQCRCTASCGSRHDQEDTCTPGKERKQNQYLFF